MQVGLLQWPRSCLATMLRSLARRHLGRWATVWGISVWYVMFELRRGFSFLILRFLWQAVSPVLSLFCIIEKLGIPHQVGQGLSAKQQSAALESLFAIQDNESTSTPGTSTAEDESLSMQEAMHLSTLEARYTTNILFNQLLLSMVSFGAASSRLPDYFCKLCVHRTPMYGFCRLPLYWVGTVINTVDLKSVLT